MSVLCFVDNRNCCGDSEALCEWQIREEKKGGGAVGENERYICGNLGFIMVVFTVLGLNIHCTTSFNSNL